MDFSRHYTGYSIVVGYILWRKDTVAELLQFADFIKFKEEYVRPFE